ncbi:MAG: TIGR03808 family TAT-translocated repetitive protein [Phyllobacteriaceae bacterium]|nr:TIGR03808 family TAT-translocated repetitive protein [Phyllobacteriaceae bacterium]
MRTNRRQFLATLGAAPVIAAPALANAAGNTSGDALFSLADLRGTANANELGLRPGAIDDQSRLFQSILEKAASENKPVFLPPGNYFVSNILLPSNTRLMGVPGASRLIYSGNGHFIIGENGSHVELSGLVLDGANRGLHSYAEAALRLTNVDHAVVDNCLVMGSIEKGIQIDRSAGRIERSKVTGAGGDCGIYGFENRGLSILSNEVSDCVNGGILVHRWNTGEDGTLVRGNRITRIGAFNGGTGQWGNGINVFRAANVMVTDNHITDCAFSAIRSNAGTEVQISSNTCLRSGETAIYSEFEFEGAVISNNIIDGGARGISIANFLQGGRLAVVSGNLIRNIDTPPPYTDDDHLWFEGISAEADTVITGNVIENAKNFGMMLGWGPYLRDVITSSNVIRGSKTGIYVSVVEGAGATHIADNTITGASNGAVVGYRWKEAVTGDMARKAEPGFPHLTVERNRVS